MTSVEVLAVNVGRPAVVGEQRGRPVRSAIRKSPVATATVRVGPDGIDGDVQANRKVHGGPAMAVYAYAADHWPAWEAVLGEAPVPGRFGENLTLRGLVETDVRVGDRFAWGDVVLRVTKPRTPCYKLDLALGREVGDVMAAMGSSGWYCAVEQPGEAPTTGPLERLGRGDGDTIADLFAAWASR